ncbi:phage tail protein [Pseudoalteromonas piscicida]|uniref:phage tail protein n=1 Tax=Pseudoalteromonas piscicida TaxID=43662 RepID=UPI001C94CA22|nr:phage tail protein [Pseudoalteromonas piscicida]QZO13870.1 phage tail protein [Pseudoalteromonas piscicida]
MALEQDIANLIQSTDALTAVVDNKAQQLDNQMAAFDTRIAKKEQDVDKFIQEAMPETRYVQDIFIGGSKDYFYPVWWTTPGNAAGVSKVTIARQYSWNADTQPLNTTSPHQAALLLELEGNATAWHGDANFLHVKRFHERYNPTVSHASFAMYCKREKADSSLDLYGGGEEGAFGAFCATHSGVYLRGGGLKYRIIKNWKGDVWFHDGSDQERRNLYARSWDNWTVRWYAEPIPFAERMAPTLSSIPYVNHPYTPPTA